MPVECSYRYLLFYLQLNAQNARHTKTRHSSNDTASALLRKPITLWSECKLMGILKILVSWALRKYRIGGRGINEEQHGNEN